jgi:hypothetical protein
LPFLNIYICFRSQFLLRWCARASLTFRSCKSELKCHSYHSIVVSFDECNKKNSIQSDLWNVYVHPSVYMQEICIAIMQFRVAIATNCSP